MSEVKVNKISPRTNCGTVTVGDSGDSVSVSAGVPVTVNGDLKSNALKATDGGSIISQCGTNITLGASGDTINLASGASQSGFGRAGSVDWQTGSIKTATFTAANGEGYFCNTTSSAFTVNLPAGSAGAIVAVSDYTRTFNSNNLTISPNGSEKIGGVAGDLILSVNGQATTLVYVDGTEGWINVQNAEDTGIGVLPTFITATGGTITTSGDFKIHTFTGPGTFCVSSVGNAAGSNSFEYLVVAGGGGGGGNRVGNGGGAGGGGGGFRTNFPSPGTAAAVQGYPVTIGAGGVGGPGPTTAGNPGSNSVAISVTSAGGGAGGSGGPCSSSKPGRNGGSGGGAGSDAPSNISGGTGNTPPVSPPQGKDGGDNDTGNRGAGGGGGGACGVAGASATPGNASTKCGSKGGDGTTTSINGTPTAFAGGGGGGAFDGCAQDGGDGGAGGGGRGAGRNDPPDPGFVNGTAGTANTGGGGGGGGMRTPTNEAGDGAPGGSGIVIIRYKYQ